MIILVTEICWVFHVHRHYSKCLTHMNSLIFYNMSVRW